VCNFRSMNGYFSQVVVGFLLGAITLLSLQGCSGPELKPWHTEPLSAEFTTDKADDIHSFADYRRLEDELFAQLEEEVYARTATGPEYALVRYSAGSAADPQQRPPNNQDVLFRGQMSIQGERDLLKLPADWLLRLRYNPFYDYLQRRVLEWVTDAPGV